MRTRTLGLLVVALTGLLVQAGLATDVAGRIVDRRGRAVRDAQVASNWSWADGRPTPYRPLEVADDGTFSGELTFRGQPVALLAYDADGDLAGAALVTEEQAGDITITMDRSLRVRARFRSSDLGGDAGWVNTYWSLGRARPVSCTAKDGRIDLRLPHAPGEEAWSSYIYGSDVKGQRTTHEIEPKQRTLDLGTLDLEGTFIALNIGLPVEDWTVSDARGLPLASAQIADLKGRWVLVEFWGHW